MIKSATGFFSGTMLSRVTGLLRDTAMAIAFGTEGSLAAFFVAFRFAHLLRRLLGENSLQTAFVPIFEALRSDSDRSTRFFIDLYAALSLILLLAVGLGSVGGGTLYYFCSDSWSQEATEILILSLIMLPSLFFICLAGLNTALLQCERFYFIPSVAPVAFNLAWIVGVLTLASIPAREAMPRLALWIVAACFLQWSVTMPKVIGLLRQAGLDLRLLKKITPFSKEIRSMSKPFILGVIGIGAAQINSACDALFARYAESSGPAYLWFAIRLQQLPLALFGIAISGALLPPLTRAIKQCETGLSHRLLDTAIRRSMLLIIPITAGLFLLGERSLDLLYGYGDFDSVSLLGTTRCLWGYTFGLIPMTLILIAAPLYYAKSDYRTPTVASGISMILNIALNSLFVLKFGLSAFSIAVATSLSAWLNLGYLLIRSESAENRIFLLSLKKEFSEVGKALMLTCPIVWLTSSSLPAGDSFFGKALNLGIPGILFVILFGCSYYLIAARENLRAC